MTNTLTQGMVYKTYSSSSAPGVPSSSSANALGMNNTVVGLSQNSGSLSSSASNQTKRK